MQFIDIIHSLEGYVTIQADGVFLERFLTICTRRNLEIWNIRHCGASRLTADMSLTAFRSIRQVCRRSQTRLKVLKRQGLPFLLHRYRRRKTALLGLAVTLLFLWYTSCHIMGITVIGNSRIPTDLILEHLARSGVALGKSTSGLDSDPIRNRMMRDLEELSWVGINVSGSRVYVEIVERLDTEPGVDMKQPCHLVARKDGRIASVEARNGQTMVKPGAGVREGDVLVSGIMDNEAHGFRFVHAYGEVYAETTYTKASEYPLSYEEAVDTGTHTTRYTLQILGRSLPLFLRGNPPYPTYAKEETQAEYRLPMDRLPSLYLKKERYREQYMESKTRTAAEALTQGTEELSEALKAELPPEAELMQQEVSHTLTERGTLAVTVTLVCRENIAREVAIDETELIAAEEAD